MLKIQFALVIMTKGEILITKGRFYPVFIRLPFPAAKKFLA